jgi:hypothetical protein
MVMAARYGSPEPELEMMKGRLATLAVANRIPSPARMRMGERSVEEEEQEMHVRREEARP